MASTLVNSGPPASLCISVSELARRKGRDKALISRQVSRFETEGRLKTYPGAGGSKLVNIVEYDRAIGETGDLLKEQAAATTRLLHDEPPIDAAAPLAPDAPAADNSLGSAQRQKILYETELKKIELAERRGLVVAVVKLTEALHRVADAIVQLIDRLPLRAAEMAAAVAKDGEAGARALFKTIAFELRAGVARSWKDLKVEGSAEEAAGPIEIDLPDEGSDL